MDRKTIKNLKIISIIFIILLVIELLYVLYMMFFNNTKDIYFDSINSMDNNSLYYVTVGSNNDNYKHYEKGKVTKYNKKKEKKFEKLYNSGFNSVFFGVNIDEDSIICVGSYEKSKYMHDNSIRNALIVKYDLDGNILFDVDYSLLDNSKFTSVSVVSDGYIVTGQSIYKSTKVGNKSGGAILVKYDESGKLLWSKTYGDNKDSIYNDLIVLNDYIYAVGYNGKSIISKYDLSGNYINTVEYTGNGFTDIMVIDNYLYVCGSNDDTGIISKYDLDLEYIKSTLYKDTGSIIFSKIISDGDSIIVIGSNALKSSNGELIDKFKYDGLIGKYNTDLDKIDIVISELENDNYYTDIKYIDNEYLVSGYSSYEDGSYLSKFTRYSKALKVLGVE